MDAKDITPIIQTVILVIIAPLMPVVVFYLRRWVNNAVSQADQRRIATAVRAAVLAAEQMGFSGDQAKNYVVAVVSDHLKQYGLSLDFGMLEALIEAEVLRQFNYPGKERA